MENKNEKALVSCIVVLLLLPVHGVVEGWGLAILWKWFVVPVFHLPALSMAQALGLGLVTYMLCPKPYATKEEAHNRLVTLIFSALVAVGMGWILRLFL